MSTIQEVIDTATPQTVTSELKDLKSSDDKIEPTTTAPAAPVEHKDADSDEPRTKRGLRFWLVYVALCLSLLLAALDLVS